MRRRLVLGSTGAATLTLLSNVAAFACDVDPEFADEIANQVPYALILYCVGLLVLVSHVGLFIYRAFARKPKSPAVFWATITLSLIVVPISYILLIMASMCGDGGHEISLYLIAFELLCLVGQIAMWRINPKLSAVFTSSRK